MLQTPMTALLEGSGLEIRPAPPDLREHLGCFWTLDGRSSAPIRTFPDGCAQVIVEGGRCFLSGPQLQPGWYTPPGKTVTGVRLRPGVTYLLLGVPVCDVVNRRVELEASGQGLEDFLRQRLAGRQVDARVQFAVDQIAEPVETIARSCRITRRQLERLMRVWVGLTPKRLSRIARFQAAMTRMREAAPEDWIRIAEGYADQPHLIREFTEFTGASPKRMMQARGPNAREARCG